MTDFMSDDIDKFRSRRHDMNSTESIGSVSGYDNDIDKFRSRRHDMNRTESIGSVSGYDKMKKIGIASVVAITYFNVSGGPFGSEEIVSSVGPFWGLTSLLIYTLTISFPIILVTTELSSALPNDGGYSIWVTEAFGEFWGVQESYWSLVSGIIDNAIYPVLIVDVAEKVIPELRVATWNQKYMIKLALCIAFCLPNLVSVKSVGKMLQFMSVIVILPFAVMVILGTRHMNIIKLTETRSNIRVGDVRQLLTVLFWNFNGYDCISTCAGEIRDPKRTISTGLFIAMIVIVLSTMLPLVVAVCWTGEHHEGDESWRNWKDGSLSASAESIGGPFMGMVMVIVAIVGNCGLFIAELLEDSYQLYGMAQVNLAPSFFGHINATFGTPVNAIMFLTSIICGLIALDFTTILCIDNFFSCISLILEMCASIRLRQIMPEMKRPYRIPVSTFGLTILLSPMFLLGTCVLLNEYTKSWTHFCLNTFGLFLGLVLWYVHKNRTRDGGKNSGYQTPRLTSLNVINHKQGYTSIPSSDDGATMTRQDRTISEFNLQ